jgi:hypothetical protein
MRLTPMPSPKGTNYANAFIIRQRVPVDRRFPLAHDELPPGSRLTREQMAARADASLNGSAFASTRADLPTKGFGEDDQTRISNLADFLRGKNLTEDDVRAAVERMLKAEGYGEDDVRTACDALGIGASARLGGAAAGSNFGGALHGEVSQPARDRTFMTDEERRGSCAYGGDSRRRFGAARDSFEFVYDRQDRLQQIREMTRPRRAKTRNEIAMDARAVDSFNARFPEARRIRNAI